jgi:hypothetical protein
MLVRHITASHTAALQNMASLPAAKPQGRSMAAATAAGARSTQLCVLHNTNTASQQVLAHACKQQHNAQASLQPQAHTHTHLTTTKHLTKPSNGAAHMQAQMTSCFHTHKLTSGKRRQLRSAANNHQPLLCLSAAAVLQKQLHHAAAAQGPACRTTTAGAAQTPTDPLYNGCHHFCAAGLSCSHTRTNLHTHAHVHTQALQACKRSCYTVRALAPEKAAVHSSTQFSHNTQPPR